MNRVLVTCPPMLEQIDLFRDRFSELGWQITEGRGVQTLSVDELKAIVPDHDGWIIGDDPATAEVLAAGRKGRLRAAVKWGVGVDNVDFAAARALGLPVTNTPNMFGAEVADLALSYVLALARHTFEIDRSIRAGGWFKPSGISLAGCTLGLVGLGDIGRHFARRAMACDMNLIVYDPGLETPPPSLPLIELVNWPDRIEELDFIVFTCALTTTNRHMLDGSALAKAKPGMRVVNVARGPLIDEAALIEALESGQVHSVALDVFEAEPLPADSLLRKFDRCIFGSHNGSNTIEAVVRASNSAILLLDGMLESR